MELQVRRITIPAKIFELTQDRANECILHMNEPPHLIVFLYMYDVIMGHRLSTSYLTARSGTYCYQSQGLLHLLVSGLYPRDQLMASRHETYVSMQMLQCSVWTELYQVHPYAGTKLMCWWMPLILLAFW